jgi:hypothetical protein
MVGKGTISIWFFIGSLLLIYGVAIFIANLIDMLWPSGTSTIVLGELHFGVWWGILLTIIGAVYFVKFRPWVTKPE